MAVGEISMKQLGKITKSSYVIPMVFLISIIINIFFISILPSRFKSIESSDYLGFYKPVALNLFNGHGLTDHRGYPAVRYPPGYPIILAGVFGLGAALHISERAITYIFTVSCMGLASVFIFLLARTFYKQELALIAALGFMTYPFSLWLTKQPNSEMPFLVTFYASLWFFFLSLTKDTWNGSFSFLSGIFLGISMLIRPIAVGLPFILALALWVFTFGKSKHHRFLLLMLLLFGVTVTVGPWEAWLYAHTGKFLLLSSGGVPAILDGLTFGIQTKGYRQGMQMPGDVKALMYHFQGLREQLDSVGSIFQAGLEQLKERPTTVLKFGIIKAIRSWFGTNSQRFEIAIMFIQLGYLVLFLWATIVSYYQRSTLKWMIIIIWIILVYFWMMTMIVLPILRYMVPAIGLLFLVIPALFEKKLASARLT
jgi:4-amino-4-deoxy-L-arabinose transferase-like glycosyltransferase